MAKIYCKSSYLLRKDTAENWQIKNPILRKGEQGLETDTGIMKIGDGTTEYNSLSDNNIYLPKSHNKNIDQTYTPESENAQSGKAVAEAVAIEQKRADNTFANALKGSKTDTAMLLDDVSPVTHEMGVKISSDTVTDLTAVKVSRCGKNLIQTNIIEVTSPNAVKKLIWQGNISGKLSFSVDNSEYTPNPSNVNSANFDFIFGDGTTKYLASYGSHMYLNTSSPLKEIHFLNWGQGTGVLKNIQLEIGSPETDYEPYKECAEYIPTADGTVNGVTSLYPNTSLMTDTDGVLIDCEYNRDINKAFAELQQAILSTGGNT